MRRLTSRTSGRWLWAGLLLAAALTTALLVVAFVKFSGSPNDVPVGADGTQQIQVASANHVPSNSPVAYSVEPPAGGDHFDDVWQNCGIYDEPLTDELVVHSMEHGAVWVTYRPDLPTDEVEQLRGIVRDGYVGSERYIVLSPYVGLVDDVVVSAWGRQLRLTDVADPRLPEFLELFAGGPQSPEPSASCTGRTGTPLD